jgi:C-terminal processing protease CtpA/Prc
VELAGIGAVLDAREEGLRVRQVVPGGGAAEAGLAPGDEILRIDGRPVTELGFAAAIQAIRGPEGTQVLLFVRRRAGQQDQASEVSVTVPRRLIRS